MKKPFYSMPYIADKTMFKAVMFVLKLKEKMAISLAIHKSAKFYKVSQSELAQLVGQIGGRKAARQNIHANYEKGYEEGGEG